jgi:hypothetical protein
MPYTAVMGDVDGGLRLYVWNAAVSAAFIESLSHLEVALRNGIHRQLTLRTGREDWWHSPMVLLTPEAADMVADAVHQASRRTASTSGHVVAALSFGFWVGLFSTGGSADYETRLWRPTLRLAFPNYRGPRRPLHQRLVNMRLLRNRIAHHEPIHYRHLAADYQRMLTILGWISTEFAAWVDGRSRVPALLAAKPAT